MAGTFFYAGDSITVKETGGANSITTALSDARPGTVQRIHNIYVYALGTVTAFSIEVLKNDGSTTITKLGGQIGGAATGPLGPYTFDFSLCPINCVPNDNAKIAFTATGASAVTINAGYKLACA